MSEVILYKSFKNIYPSVSSAKIIFDLYSGNSKGYGFIKFSSVKDYERALVEMDGFLLSNKKIRVNRANSNKLNKTAVLYSSEIRDKNQFIEESISSQTSQGGYKSSIESYYDIFDSVCSDPCFINNLLMLAQENKRVCNNNLIMYYFGMNKLVRSNSQLSKYGY